MKKLIYMMAFLAMAVQITSCKKDDKEDDSTPAASVLCDGKGGSSWIRLDSSNTWTYDYTIAGMNQQEDPTLRAGTTTEHDGYTYRVVTDESGGWMQLTDYEYREDATTHDLYRYHEFYDEEWLEVPGSPTLNQEWSIFVNYTRKVTNLSASITTSSCSYTGLLEIVELDGNSEITKKLYYKKGLGLVKQINPDASFESVFTLISVAIK